MERKIYFEYHAAKDLLVIVRHPNYAIPLVFHSQLKGTSLYMLQTYIWEFVQ